jgi:hypothetical protein
VGEGKIHLGLDEIAGGHALDPRVPGKNLFRYCLRHRYVTPAKVIFKRFLTERLVKNGQMQGSRHPEERGL